MSTNGVEPDWSRAHQAWPGSLSVWADRRDESGQVPAGVVGDGKYNEAEHADTATIAIVRLPAGLAARVGDPGFSFSVAPESLALPPHSSLDARWTGSDSELPDFPAVLHKELAWPDLPS